MSVLGDIESDIVALVTAIDDGRGPVFATVNGLAADNRKSALGRVCGWSMPAAGVLFDGRERFRTSISMLGEAKFSILIAAKNLRSAGGARLGDVDGIGCYELSQRVFSVLEGASLGSKCRLVGTDEQVVSADDRLVVIEQSWVAKWVASGFPTFGGARLVGSDSFVSVLVDKRECDAVEFAFPGVDGVYRHSMGVRGRTVRWVGRLRAIDDASLNVIEERIEKLVGDSAADTVVDGFGRPYRGCVLDWFDRDGERCVHPVTGWVSQGFEIGFVQLAGGEDVA